MGEVARATEIDAIVGMNVKRLRQANKWSQDELARRVRSWGLRWSSSVIAGIEAGTKTLDLSEVLLLALVFERGVPELLAGPGAAYIGGARLSLTEARDLLTPRPKFRRRGGLTYKERAAVVAEMDEALSEARRRWPDSTMKDVQIANRDLENDAERKAARRLGVSTRTVALAAHRLWKRSLTAERERLMAELSTAADDGRSSQTRRGHITRGLVAELDEFLSKGQ